MAERRPVPLRRRVARGAGGCAFLAASIALRWAPAGLAERLGILAGRLHYRLDAKHRNRALRNLAMCFPEWDRAKVEATARKVFEHFAKTAARFLRGDRMTPADVMRSVEANGLEAIDKALREGRGVILVTAHLGNWERLGQFLTLSGYKLSVVARDANVQGTTERVNALRRASGMDVLPRGTAAKEMLRRLSRNELVGILPDQNTREIFVPFFGRPAGTVGGPAVIHMRTGAPILSAFCTERPDGKYLVEVRALELPGLSGDRNEDTVLIMQAVNDAIEAAIRRHPAQWLWMHDRWKAARQAGLIEEAPVR